MFANRSSNVCWIVAVSTDVPLMNATPMITASAVSTKRILCAARPLRVTFHIVLPAQSVHLLEDRGRAGIADLVDDLSVGEEDHAARVRGRGWVVRDHHDRLPELGHGALHELEDLGARTGVEVSGGLVGEDDLGLTGQRACDRDALLLATGEPRRAVREPGAQPHGVDDAVDPLLVALAPGERHGQL